MPNRKLTHNEIEVANQLVVEVRRRLKELSANDATLEWAMRRYVYLRLLQDERGTATDRKLLKAKLKIRQHGKCTICHEDLPEKGAELDRLEAMKGYTESNTRVLCHRCHVAIQERRRYT
jgi:hypothetical protein